MSQLFGSLYQFLWGVEMKKYDIDIKSILSKGHVVTDVKSEMLYITTTRRLSTNFEKENMALDSYVYIPGTFSCPYALTYLSKLILQDYTCF